MEAKIVLILAIAASAMAGFRRSPYQAYSPIVAQTVVQPEVVTYAKPLYDYSYSVHDGITGDSKRHSESRRGDEVQGEYALMDPDGFLRVVRYIANKNGFNAIVSRNPHGAPIVNPVPIQSPPVFAQQTHLPVFPQRPRFIHGFPAAQQVLIPGGPIHHPQIIHQQFKRPIHKFPTTPIVQPSPPTQTQQPPLQEIPESTEQSQSAEQPDEISSAAPVTPEIPQTTSAPFQQSPDPQPSDVQADDGEAVVVEAIPRRAGPAPQRQQSQQTTANQDSGSSFTYSSKRGSLYDFTVTY